MSAAAWYLVIGALLLLIALMGGRIARWPLTTAMIYLVIGLLLGHFGWLQLDIGRDAKWLELASEVAVIVSLFSAGLKLRLPLNARDWHLPFALATVSMTVTVALIAGAGFLWFGLPLGAAVVLGAILAPTDPVLASDVQVSHTGDVDPVRLSLTGEAGLNDGIAFPFLMLGLSLLGHYELGEHGLRWLTYDVLWKVPAGFVTGSVVGGSAAYAVLYLRRHYGEALGYDDFLALGVIATAYGLAHVTHSYGFVAVFAAGLAVRAVERRETTARGRDEPEVGGAGNDAMARDQAQAPAYLAAAVLRFNDHMDRIGELALVLVVGTLLATMEFDLAIVLFALALFLLIRPLAVLPVCGLCGMQRGPALLVSWFGIRGIGSIYYLTYAITHGLPPEWIQPIAAVTLTVIAASTLLHGVTSTPAMRAYSGKRPRRSAPP